MKKYLWLMALIAALALLVTGCPTGGDDNEPTEPEFIDLLDAFPGTQVSQTLYNGNQEKGKNSVIVTSNNVVMSITEGNELWSELQVRDATEANEDDDKVFDASAYTGFKFEYKSVNNATILLQDTTGVLVFGINDSDGWGSLNAEEDWTEIELSFSILKEAWGSSHSGNVTLDKANIIKIMIGGTLTNGTDKFELRNFQGIGGSGTTDPEDGTTVEASSWYLANSEDGEAVTGNTKIVNAIAEDESFVGYVYIYFSHESSGFEKIKLTYETEGQFFKQCVWDASGTWGWGWGNIKSSDEILLTDTTGWGTPEGSTLDTKTVKGICLKISFENAADSVAFTLTKVELMK